MRWSDARALGADSEPPHGGPNATVIRRRTTGGAPFGVESRAACTCKKKDPRHMAGGGGREKGALRRSPKARLANKYAPDLRRGKFLGRFFLDLPERPSRTEQMEPSRREFAARKAPKRRFLRGFGYRLPPPSEGSRL